MIAKLRAIWASDSTTIVLGALTIAMGLKLINEVTEKRTAALAEVGQELTARRAELDGVTADHKVFVAAAEGQRARWREELSARYPGPAQIAGAEVDR